MRNTYRWEVWVSYNFALCSVGFKKEFNLPFVPFKGMCLMDGDNEITFESDEYGTKNTIAYDVMEDYFYVEQSSYLRKTPDEQWYNYLVEQFAEWEPLNRNSDTLVYIKSQMK